MSSVKALLRGLWLELPALEGHLLPARSAAEEVAGDVYICFNNDIHGYAVHNALALRKMVVGQ